MITMKPEVTKKIENVIERIQDDGGFVELAKGLAKDLEEAMEKEKQTPPKEPS